MTTSGERLKQLLRECSLTASDFAAQRKITPQHVNNWFHRGVPQARMDEIAELLCVRSRWLRTGEGPKHHTPLPRLCYRPGETEPIPPDHSLLAAHAENDALLPFFRSRDGELLPHARRELRLPRALLDSLEVEQRHALAVSMPDYNMAPLMPYGCTLAIDRSVTWIVDGEPYALMHNGFLRVHYLNRRPNGTLRLHSHDGEEYPTESYRPLQARKQQLYVVGWVFWWSQQREKRPG